MGVFAKRAIGSVGSIAEARTGAAREREALLRPSPVPLASPRPVLAGVVAVSERARPCGALCPAGGPYRG